MPTPNINDIYNKLKNTIQLLKDEQKIDDNAYIIRTEAYDIENQPKHYFLVLKHQNDKYIPYYSINCKAMPNDLSNRYLSHKDITKEYAMYFKISGSHSFWSRNRHYPGRETLKLVFVMRRDNFEFENSKNKDRIISIRRPAIDALIAFNFNPTNYLVSHKESLFNEIIFRVGDFLSIANEYTSIPNITNDSITATPNSTYNLLIQSQLTQSTNTQDSTNRICTQILPSSPPNSDNSILTRDTCVIEQNKTLTEQLETTTPQIPESRFAQTSPISQHKKQISPKESNEFGVSSQDMILPRPNSQDFGIPPEYEKEFWSPYTPSLSQPDSSPAVATNHSPKSNQLDNNLNNYGSFFTNKRIESFSSPQENKKFKSNDAPTCVN